ncbi:LOW QUALITY PROTEIN: baculoviral IAP repeat-containing protein 3-like [Homarus americanus]|uniref:LOW QUALITY PROTEIN: baculoviral IAP repeat-containing protein 3-like n=1 Tax=Homarus americanus TaxID=6706 RepID=UPI001C479326|nr:LOW QUALITY PROTEIN: baculoviral IAP repeat-containing protein 3-like [Homarus americanus]
MTPFITKTDNSDLANAGFYYRRKEDHCACYFCRGIVGKWEENVFPIEEHSRHYSHCPFVRNKPTGNISLSNLECDTSAAFDSEAFHREKQPQCIFSCTLNRSKTLYNIHKFRFEKEQLDTFVDWPLRSWISPEDFAPAGFYYLRTEDFCAVFFCRGIIGNWDQDVFPIEEYNRHHSHCPFVKNQPTGNISLGHSCILDHIIPIPKTEKDYHHDK